MTVPGPIRLDLLDLTGPVTMEMPGCVLAEIASSRRIIFNTANIDDIQHRADIVRTIESCGTVTISCRDPKSHAELRAISSYVNPNRNISWKRSDLLIAFNWLRSCHERSSIPRDAEDFLRLEKGDLRPCSPRRLTACILYGWCLQLGGVTDSRMTVDVLYDQCYYMLCPASLLVNRITAELSNIDVSSLARIMTVMCAGENRSSSPPERMATFGQIDEAYELLSSNGAINSTTIPQNPGQAVVLAASVHCFDLTKSELPISDYYRISDGRSLTDKYMEKVLLLNPEAYSVRHNFNPFLPAALYDLPTLRSFCEREGLSISRLGNLSYYHQELCMTAMTDNFHKGVQHGVPDTFITSILNTDLNEEPEEADLIVCYGSFTSKMTMYTTEELTGLFETNGNFRNPEGGVFTKTSIDKLKRIASYSQKWSCNRQPSRDVAKACWRRLADAIFKAERKQENMNERCQDLQIIYSNLSKEEQREIRDILFDLRDLGMKMRGWRGGDEPYPVSGNIVDSDIELTRTAVSLSMSIFEKKCSDSRHGSNIKSLPLVLHRDGNFIVSTEPKKGLTIGDRLAIVRDINNINSCIRTSSNWICSSSYNYIVAIGENPGFNIEELRHVY